ncbi:MAG: DUF192 domain-containing protein [Acidimicrobiales bacterium]
MTTAPVVAKRRGLDRLVLCRAGPPLEAIAPVDVARSAWRRGVGLMGAREVPTPMLFPLTASVHTAFVRVTLDVALLDGSGVVVAIRRLRPWRAILPRRGVKMVLEAAEGTFISWHLVPGERLVSIDLPSF